MTPRLLKTRPSEPKKREKLSATQVAWQELVPYVHDIEKRLTAIEQKQDQLLYLLAQIARDADEMRKARK